MSRTLIHHRRRGKPLAPLPVLTPVALAIGVFAITPIAYLVDRATNSGWSGFVDDVFRSSTGYVVIRSVVLVVVATTLCTVVGVAAAVIVDRADLPAPAVWRVLLALPLAIPTYLAGFAWVAEFPGMKGLWAATLVLVACSFPYVYLPVLAALSQVDRAQEDVARSLGRSAFGAFVSVTVPQIRRAITAGALLTGLYVLSDFGAVGSMRYQAFTWEIFQSYRAGFNADRAASLAVVLVVGGALLVIAERAARGGAQSRSARSAQHSDRNGWSRRARFVGAGTLSALLGACVVFPVATVVRWFGRSVGSGVAWGDLGAALWASTRYSLLAAAVTTLLALPVALAAARRGGRLDRAAEGLTYVTHALPSVVIGISMIFLSLRVVPRWYQRPPVLVAAYVLLFLPLAVASSRAALDRCARQWEESALSLGSSQVRTLLHVTLRVAAPGLAAGAALTALATLKELPTTLLLHPTGTDTLAMELWTKTGVSDLEGAAPYALALVLFAAVPTALLGWFTGRHDHDAHA